MEEFNGMTAEEAHARLAVLKEKVKYGAIASEFAAGEEKCAGAHMYKTFYVSPLDDKCFQSDEEVDEMAKLSFHLEI